MAMIRFALNNWEEVYACNTKFNPLFFVGKTFSASSNQYTATLGLMFSKVFVLTLCPFVP